MGAIRAPFVRWLEQFEAAPIRDREHGAGRVALIADDRDDDVTRRVFANAVAVLGPTWNHRYLPVRGDNDLLASRAFWDSIPEEHVLIYQRDTVLFRPVPASAFAWDMIGAPCGNVNPPSAMTLNGGLSLRKRSAMLAVIDGVARLSIAPPEVSRPISEPEDVYFTRGLRRLGRSVPDRATAGRFAVESAPDYAAPPTGVHGTDKWYLPESVAEQLVAEAFSMRQPHRKERA